ncbi:hypothetical protein CBR_g30651 [Chara braunii]|uniref:Uncharacterized protein n=1 Tax=Chara braunii TaxID=69332 RepID=A0A388LDA0_CHABU|nr:hypothetical protein CBR_g30651 [Chara braunii]|eukprot:GBG80284.1 hypothetical protein CBR_g30651 [Chara braunii]
MAGGGGEESGPRPTGGWRHRVEAEGRWTEVPGGGLAEVGGGSGRKRCAEANRRSAEAKGRLARTAGCAAGCREAADARWAEGKGRWEIPTAEGRVGAHSEMCSGMAGRGRHEVGGRQGEIGDPNGGREVAEADRRSSEAVRRSPEAEAGRGMADVRAAERRWRGDGRRTGGGRGGEEMARGGGQEVAEVDRRWREEADGRRRTGGGRGGEEMREEITGGGEREVAEEERRWRGDADGGGQRRRGGGPRWAKVGGGRAEVVESRTKEADAERSWREEMEGGGEREVAETEEKWRWGRKERGDGGGKQRGGGQRQRGGGQRRRGGGQRRRGGGQRQRGGGQRQSHLGVQPCKTRVEGTKLEAVRRHSVADPATGQWPAGVGAVLLRRALFSTATAIQAARGPTGPMAPIVLRS